MADFRALSRLNNAMSLRPKLIHPKIPVWLQYVGVATAGVASFVVALQIGSPGTPLGGGIELREKMAARLPAAGSPKLPNSPSALPRELDGSAERLDPGILQNPFAPLNLLARVDTPEPSRAPELPTADVVPTVKRPPKVRPVIAAPPLVAPPSPILVPAPAPIPVAPTLPFTVVGTIQSPRIATGKAVAFLQDRGDLIVVHAGDEINRLYRIESISEDKIEFLYLPLKTKQFLAIAH